MPTRARPRVGDAEPRRCCRGRLIAILRVTLLVTLVPGRPSLVFEIQMGMLGRGADVSWLSEFPNEAEILFGPLTGLEIRGSRVEGAVQVYEVAITTMLSIRLASWIATAPVPPAPGKMRMLAPMDAGVGFRDRE